MSNDVGQRVACLCGRYIWVGTLEGEGELPLIPSIRLTGAIQVVHHVEDEVRESYPWGTIDIPVTAIEACAPADKIPWCKGL